MAPLLRPDPDSFPVEPPDDTDSAEVIAAHDWAAFSAVEEVTDHWSRPGWADGSRAYYWMLTFPYHPELSALALRCQKELAGLGLDPVPADDGLHITLARVGSPDDVTPRQLDALARLAATVLPTAFSLRAMPLAGSRGAVRLSVAPWRPLVSLHASLSNAGHALAIATTRPTFAFRPHLSVAYQNARRPAAPVIEAVAPLRSLDDVDIAVTEVRLVELRRSGATYRWDVLHSLPLVTT
ncbi:hypothetical protein GCM10009716_47540 [Streptomyces sodiiphilus]|uniref:2'-5' RNA ligase family protein n=1 Tax=Streptomyces sodiiphilus TaxID=226217 RepID=A0ABN2PWV5_9ACTN